MEEKTYMTIVNDTKLRRMGYVCDECGGIKPPIRSCSKGCTKICVDCLDKKRWKWTVCKKCGETIKR